MQTCGKERLLGHHCLLITKESDRFVIDHQESFHILLWHSVYRSLKVIKKNKLKREKKFKITKNISEKYEFFSQVTRNSLLSATSFKVCAIGFNFGTVSNEVKTPA